VSTIIIVIALYRAGFFTKIFVGMGGGGSGDLLSWMESDEGD